MSGSIPAVKATQGMPNMGVPLTNADRTVAYAWYQFFVALFNAVLSSPGSGVSGTPGPAPGTISEVYEEIEGLQPQITAQEAQITALQDQVRILTNRLANAGIL